MFYPSKFALIATLLLGVGDLVVASSAVPRKASPSRALTRQTHKLKSSIKHSDAPFAPRGGGPKASTTSSKVVSIGTKTAVLCGCALAFNSGFVNGACLSGILSSDGTKQAAAAVTGAWTNSALGVASGNYGQAKFNAKCLGSYFSGSLVASLINPNPVPFEVGGADKISPAFLIGSLSCMRPALWPRRVADRTSRSSIWRPWRAAFRTASHRSSRRTSSVALTFRGSHPILAPFLARSCEETNRTRRSCEYLHYWRRAFGLVDWFRSRLQQCMPVRLFCLAPPSSWPFQLQVLLRPASYVAT